MPHLPSPPIILLIQILATAMMTGIIWFVQVVHYPLVTRIPKEGFTGYEQAHTVRTGWVVAPLMLLELGTSLLLLVYRPDGHALPISTSPLYLAALGCLILIWLSTFLVQVPLHVILEKQPDHKAMLLLDRSNWIRTILWTLRLGFLALLPATTGLCQRFSEISLAG